MNRFQKVFNSIAIYILLGISLLAVLTFGITSFLVTYSLDGGAIQKDNIAISIVIIVFACLLALGGGRLLKFIRCSSSCGYLGNLCFILPFWC